MPSDATDTSAGPSIARMPVADTAHNGAVSRTVPLTVEQSISRCFERQARRYASRTAVVGANAALTYAQLNAWANRWARGLLAHSNTPSQLVAILLPKDAALFAAILGTLKAGKAYVVLDPSHPAHRLATLLDDAGTGTTIVTDRELESTARELAGSTSSRHQVLRIDDPGLDEHAASDLEFTPTSDALAYLIYTSGSTGTPKGVMQTHGNVLSNTSRHVKALRVTHADRLTLIASPATGQAATDIYCTLLTGATVYPVDVRTVGFDRLARWLRRQEITIYHSSASMFRSLLDALEETDTIPRVRVVKLGSEQVYRRDVERGRLHFPTHCVFVNALSSSEAGVMRQIHLEHDAPLDFGSVVPVGYPVEHINVSLVDAERRPVPPGDPGEIVVRGEYLSPGYWKRPELTRAAFGCDPSGGPARSFSTGDHGRITPDGRLVYLGRSDDQVKIRGFRVETAEVEAAIVDHPAVRQAVVRVLRDDAGQATLAAYVVPREGAALTSRELDRVLRTRLPLHMIPTALAILGSLPLTTSGKLNVQALPPISRSPRSGGSTEYRKPRTQIEILLANIWEELLGVGPVGVHDDFFDLGGHSLLAIQMMDRAEKVCGLRVPLSTLLRGATIEQLTAEMLRSDPNPMDARLIELQPGTGLRPFVFLHGEFNGGGVYCRQLAARLGPDRPFAVIPPHGHDGDDIPATIEAMAADRLHALLEYQPQGPYLLGGYCNGGLVAFEMARQLERRGALVDLLVLVDARALNVRFAWLQRLVAILGRVTGLGDQARSDTFFVLRSLAIALHNGPRTFGRELLHRARRAAHRMKSGAHASVRRRIGAAAVRAHDARPIDAIYDEAFKVYRDIMDRYVPARYEGRVALFHSRGMAQRSPRDATAGWGRVVPDPKLHFIPGEHQTCLTDHLDVLATQLSAVLAQVDAGHPALHET